MRGAGKTTIGRLVAAKLGWQFIDLDDRALAMAGSTSVRHVFASQGETRWREAEASALKELLAHTLAAGPRVCAVGAGAPSHPDSHLLIRQAARAGWLVVRLSAPIDEMTARLKADMGDRAALTSLRFDEEMRQLCSQREGEYRQLAQADVDSSGNDPEAVAQRVVALAKSPT